MTQSIRRRASNTSSVFHRTAAKVETRRRSRSVDETCGTTLSAVPLCDLLGKKSEINSNKSRRDEADESLLWMSRASLTSWKMAGGNASSFSASSSNLEYSQDMLECSSWKMAGSNVSFPSDFEYSRDLLECNDDGEYCQEDSDDDNDEASIRLGPDDEYEATLPLTGGLSVVRGHWSSSASSALALDLAGMDDILRVRLIEGSSSLERSAAGRALLHLQASSSSSQSSSSLLASWGEMSLDLEDVFELKRKNLPLAEDKDAAKNNSDRDSASVRCRDEDKSGDTSKTSSTMMGGSLWYSDEDLPALRKAEAMSAAAASPSAKSSCFLTYSNNNSTMRKSSFLTYSNNSSMMSLAGTHIPM